MRYTAPGGEIRIASLPLETPTSDDQVMERILERENLKRALKRVRENKGAPGVDGMKVGQLLGYLWVVIALPDVYFGSMGFSAPWESPA